MSDSVSFRVVIIWVVVIVLFAGMAIFGLMNQDLLKHDEDEQNFIPNVATENSMSCTAYIDRAKIIYDFVLTDNSKIKSLRIAYNAINGTTEDFEAANRIQALSVNGFNGTIQNEYTNFLLMMYLNEDLDYQTLSSNSTYFNDLYLVLSNVTTYSEYNTLLLNKYNNIKCIDTSK